MRRRAILMMPKGERPHPRQSNRRRCGVEDAADNDAIGKHVEIVIIPLTGWAGSRCALVGKPERPRFRGTVRFL
jgi:hypothetical protein